jgi:hypothetical protein
MYHPFVANFESVRRTKAAYSHDSQHKLVAISPTLGLYPLQKDCSERRMNPTEVVIKTETRIGISLWKQISFQVTKRYLT